MSCKTRIILVDWDKCPLYRKKKVAWTEFECGIGRFLKNVVRLTDPDKIEIVLIISSDDVKKNVVKKYTELKEQFPIIQQLHFRDNYARDIGAYDFGYRLCLNEHYYGRIIFVNSSVSGPHHEQWLEKYEALFSSKSKIGLTGTAVNAIADPEIESEYKQTEHVHSWLLYSDMKVLQDSFGDSLLSKTFPYNTKKEIIHNGEIYISKKVLDAGYGINCMAFPEYSFFRNQQWPYPFIAGWRFKRKDLAQFINTTIV